MPITNDEQLQRRQQALQSAIEGGMSPGDPNAVEAKAEIERYVAERSEEKRQTFLRENVDTSPIEPVPFPQAAERRIPQELVDQIESRAQERPDERTLINNARSRGVDTTTGLDAGTRAKVDLLGDDPRLQARAMETMLRKRYEQEGIEIPEGMALVFPDQSTGRMSFLRPTEDGKLRPTLVNPRGLDAGDALSSLDDLAMAGLETAGAVGGGMAGLALGKGPGSTMMGGAAGAGAANFLGQGARRMVAEGLGVPGAEEMENSGGESLGVAAVELAVPSAMRLGRKFLDRNKPLEPGDLDDINMQDFLNLRDDTTRVQDRMGANFKAGLAGATRNPRLLRIATEARRRATGAESDRQVEEDIGNLVATGRAVEALRGNYVVPDAGPFSRSQDVDAAVAERARRPAERASAREERRQAELERRGVDVGREPSAPRDYIFFQNDLANAATEARQTNTKNWGRWRKTIGVNENSQRADVMLVNQQPGGGTTEFVDTMNAIFDESAEALRGSQRRAQRALLADLGYDVSEVPEEAVEQVAADVGEAAALPSMVDPQVDVNAFHRMLSQLEADYAQEVAKQGSTGWNRTDLAKLIRAAKSQFYTQGFVTRQGRPVSEARAAKVRDQYDEAVDSQARVSQVFEAEAVLRIVDPDPRGKGFGFAAGPDVVRNTLLTTGNATSLDQAMRTGAMNSQHREMLVNEMRSIYREQAMPGDKFSATGHTGFLRNYGQHMDLLMGNESWRGEFRNVADMDRLVRQAEGATEAVTRAAKRAFGDKLGDPRSAVPSNYAKEIFEGNHSTAQVQNMLGAIDRADPVLSDAIRYHAQNYVESKVSTRGGLTASTQGLNSLLRDQRDSLELVFGDQYVSDLESVSRLMTAVDAEKLGEPSRDVLQTPTLQVFRTLFGPLSKTQRRISAVQSFNRRAREKQLDTILTKPEQLRTLVKAARMRPGSVMRLQGLLAVGINVDDMPTEEQELYGRLEGQSPGVDLYEIAREREGLQ